MEVEEPTLFDPDPGTPSPPSDAARPDTAATATGALVERIRRNGPVAYDELVELALYHSRLGFFGSARGSAGRAGGDFVTSPEVGPLFGAVVARALDRWWHDLGEPDPFVVVEAGAGRGALALSVLDAAPRCLPALRYVLVERSTALRERQHDHVRIEPPGNAFGALTTGEPGEEPRPRPGEGPIVVSLPELPGVRCTGVVIANELMDNLPFRLLERHAEGWREVRVGLGDHDEPVEVDVLAHPTLSRWADELAPSAPVGARIPVQRAAADWLRAALDVVDRGRVVVFDYVDDTPSMATRPWREWLRTYRQHGRGAHPVEALGDQDITCEVAVDQLGRVRRPTSARDQASWLAGHGLEALVDEGRTLWDAAAAAPDVAALKGRSRVTEAEALTASPGLGAHQVLEWETGSSSA